MTLRLAPPLPPEPSPEPAAEPDELDHEFFRTESLAPVELDAYEDDDAQAKSRQALRLGLSILGATGAALGGVILCLHLLIPTAAELGTTTPHLPSLLPAAAASSVVEAPQPLTISAPTVPQTVAVAPQPTEPKLQRSATAHTAVARPASGDDARVRAAYRALSRGDANTAITQARRVVDSSPTRADAWLVLGSAYDQLHDTQSAKLAFRACALRGRGTEASTCAALAR